MVKGIKGKKNKYDAPVILDYNMNMWVIIITFSIISHFNRFCCKVLNLLSNKVE
ncbi:hypothetical protein L5D_27080 [Enterococcus faecalis]|uniref:Uncharacterized protein n=1 Tax=Enterococcus faecalis TaxID=1351 RepID=A0A2Z2CKQ3_ENTFL|nr:hypothetical protein pEF123-020 [Enterococcus faecalis]GMC16001.1 hypothetical protein L5D_27080 [Enterococcus faecalis]